PLPRELTTPPVTKICLAIRPCLLDHLFQRHKPMGRAHGLDPASFQFTTLSSDLQSRKIRPRETKGHCGKSARIPGNPHRYRLRERNERRCRLGWLVRGRGRAAVRVFPAARAPPAPMPPAEAETLCDTHIHLSAEEIAAAGRRNPVGRRERRESDCG